VGEAKAGGAENRRGRASKAITRAGGKRESGPLAHHPGLAGSAPHGAIDRNIND
jgi:hypothetical protein